MTESQNTPELEIAEQQAKEPNQQLVIAHFLNAKKNLAKIERSLAGSLKVETFMQLAMNTIRRSEKLLQCTPHSVLDALTQAAELQLFPGNNLGHAYLVPFWDKKAGATLCTYILGYKGMLALCHRSDQVKKVEAHLVFPEDSFSMSYGDGEHLTHEPDPWAERNAKDALGAYARATMENGATLVKTLSRAELDAAKRRSKASNYGPWVTDFGAMCLKTAVRRLSPWLPLEPSDQAAIAQDMETEYGALGDDEPREVEAEEVSAEQLAAALSGEVIDMPSVETEERGPGITQEQFNAIADWMASEHCDPGLMRQYVEDQFGVQGIDTLTETQAQEVLDAVERGEFEPVEE